MKLFHISDVLTATTGRLVSSRHVDGMYDIYNFLTGDELYTHQIPRAHHECLSWLRAQFPMLMEDSPGMASRLSDMKTRIAAVPQTQEAISPVVALWVEETRVALGLSEMLPVYELSADMHTHIDPIEEAEAMIGNKNVIKVAR